MRLKKCVRCNLPETYETIEFDGDGVCNICNQHKYKDEAIDWDAKRQELSKIIESYRGKHIYDCIVPFSGGKDSTFTLYYLVKEYGLKPLVVQFDHGFMRPGLLENNQRTLKKLGVDFLSFTPNWRVVKLLMRESLLRKGDFCWHCHTGIFSYPMHVAIQHNVPLIIWGEPSTEYTAYYDVRDDVERVDETRFNRFINLGLSSADMYSIISRDNTVDRRDFHFYGYPEKSALRALGYSSICLGSYIRWNTAKQSELISRELGWKGQMVEGMPPGMYEYEKIECFMQGVRDYIKFLKRGYGRVSQMTALDLRNGRIDPQLAKDLITKYEGKRPRTLDVFLGYLEMSEEEFNSIVLNTAVPPHVPNFKGIELVSEEIPDFNAIYKG